MHYRLFGRTGLYVSELCFGAMTFGGKGIYESMGKTAQTEADKLVSLALDSGINFFDTSDVYSAGESEKILGNALGVRRKDVVLATKVRGSVGPGANQQGLSRAHIISSIDGSLKRLGTDWIDLYQIHGFDPVTPFDETLRAFDDIVRAGKARYVGCSNYPAWQTAKGLGRSDLLGVARWDCVQPRYNLLFRQPERDLLPLCQEEGLGVIPYNPLAGGFLSGKHRRESGPTAGTRFTLGTAATRYQERYWREREFETVEALRSLAAEAGMSMTQLALAWVLANPVITSPIVGASRAEQLDDVVATAGKTLDAGLKARLDELTAEYRLGDDAR